MSDQVPQPGEFPPPGQYPAPGSYPPPGQHQPAEQHVWSGWGPGYHPGYGPPGYPPPGTNGLAIASLITAFAFAPVGLILGLVALGQIRRTGQDGHGLALAGAIVGGVFTAVLVLYVVVFIVLIANLPDDTAIRTAAALVRARLG